MPGEKEGVLPSFEFRVSNFDCQLSTLNCRLSTLCPKSFNINTYEKCVCNSFNINTYKNKGLKVL